VTATPEPFVDALPVPQRLIAGEHEDRDMMRPFVTMPAELMPFMS
jgi:hypothetical protein